MRRGRFAPTPSGQLHMGNVWTALLAWLQMRHVGGEFVLRVEDIDKPRSRPEYVEQCIEDLRWLGLDWEEGPDVGGPFAPYEQSAREPLYEQALQQLQQDGWLYPCFCSRADLLAIASAPHGLPSEGPVYPGTCRSLPPTDRAEKAIFKDPSLRFALPERSIVFEDLLAGTQHFPAGAGGDFVVKRSDGIIGYQLAVVVDDAAMQITDVLRGADLLDSTPRQILLYEALGLPVPQFAHVPLLLGPDGQRLSKRDRSVSISYLRQTGTAPETLVGYLAYWGGQQARPEPVAAKELIASFDLRKIPREPVVIEECLLHRLTSE